MIMREKTFTFPLELLLYNGKLISDFTILEGKTVLLNSQN